jgi:hypothetical protein
MEFIEYVDVFDIKKTGVLLIYNKNKYTINLNENKLPFEYLYNLLTKKQKIIRTYLNAALAKE